MILAALTFSIASSTFKPGAAMPMSTVYTECAGTNISPELHWSGAPRGTKSFALVVHDPDAPHPGGWYHWVLYDVPASTNVLQQGELPKIGWRSGVNDFGKAGYSGPCPPAGKPHHYDFTLYALDESIVQASNPTGPQLEQAIQGHVLGKTTVTGLYQTH